MIALSRDVGVDLLRALGIQTDYCRKAVITVEVGSFLVVEAEYLPEGPQDEGIEILKKKYFLTANELNPEMALNQEQP